MYGALSAETFAKKLAFSMLPCVAFQANAPSTMRFLLPFLLLLSIAQSHAITLISANTAGEDWNTGSAWEDGAIPSSEADYEVNGATAGNLNSPATTDPTFTGRSLSITGPNARLVLEHRGVATVNGLSLTNAILVSRLNQSLDGDGVSIAGENGILIENSADLEIRTSLFGIGSIEVLGTDNGDGTSSGGIVLTGARSNHHVDWILNRASLRAVAPGSTGNGNITLIQGRLDFDYHASLPNTTLGIQGEGFHLELDQHWVLGALVVLVNGDVTFELPAGSYTTDSLINDIGFTAEMVSGDGTLTIAGAGSDSDGDGLLDSWETENIGNLASEADDDSDSDGLTNAFEFALGTNPGSSDSDADGLKDGVETRTGFFVSASNTGSDPTLPDSDADGLSDGEEVNTHNTSPVAADTDGDGLTDPVEISEHGTAPDKADTDGDGNNDSSELLIGTDPLDATSSFTLIEMGATRFEEPAIGATSHSGGDEIGWTMDVTAGIAGTTDTLDGVALPNRQLVMNNAALTWQSAVVPLRGFGSPTVSVGARVYQTSTGIENDDFIDLKVSLSTDGGVTFPDELILLQVEGTRTGVGASGRQPLEDVFSIDGPADGPLVHFTTAFGQIPPEVTHLQVVIDASNNSNSERFLFDEVIVQGVALVDSQVDTDSDGLKDLIELQNGLNPNDASDATSDFDEDGLDNATEIGLGTRYTLADTDGDSLSDGDEVNTHGTNPLSVDSDNDSLSDPEELATHETDPNLADTDADGFDDALEIRFGADPNVPDEAAPFGPSNAVSFTWFEQAKLGATEFSGAGANDLEVPWLLFGQGVDGGVIDALDGVALPDRQLYIHGGNLTFTTDAIPVSNPENVEVSVDTRVYQTSSGLENMDFIDIIVQASDDGGTTFRDVVLLLSVEGTRNGASGAARTPIEDVLSLVAPADGPFVTFASSRGSIPAGATHVRVIIDAANDSASERFLFDNITVRERPDFAADQDTDNDGIPDGWEFDNGFDRKDTSDAELDPDSDSLTNIEEFLNGTDPNQVDTDDDGLNDGQEVAIGSSPILLDTDNDGLDDGNEVLSTMTDPTKADTDDDGFNDRLEIALGGDPLVPDPDQTLVPEGVVAFTSFEQATLGATTFQFSGIEMGWQTTTTGEVGIRSEIVGVPLPNQALVVHNSALTWTSDIVAISNPETVITTVAARVYQESTGIESEDFIDIRMQISGDGMAFVDLPHFLSIEGTRLGPSGGTRTPLEDALNVDAAADASFSTFQSAAGDIPAGTTHIRIVIDAQNNSSSERFVFDNIAIVGEGAGVVPAPTAAPPLSIVVEPGESATITWESIVGERYRIEYLERLMPGNWTPLDDLTAVGPTTSFTHNAVVGKPNGFYRVQAIGRNALE